MSCRVVRHARPRRLPRELLLDALNALSPSERSWVLRRFDHFVREHPCPPLDDETAAFLTRFDTSDARIDLAKDLLADRGTDEMHAPWRVADYLLDLNQEHSSVMCDALKQDLAAAKLEVRRNFATKHEIPLDSVELVFGMDERGPWYLARERLEEKLPGP